MILDEIGRGTSTFDGLSIAWSVAEYLHDEVKCAHALRHALPRTHRARDDAPRRAELQRRRARVERPDHLPAQDHQRRRGQELRHPGRAAGRLAARRSSREPRKSWAISSSTNSMPTAAQPWPKPAAAEKLASRVAKKKAEKARAVDEAADDAVLTQTEKAIRWYLNLPPGASPCSARRASTNPRGD